MATTHTTHSFSALRHMQKKTKQNKKQTQKTYQKKNNKNKPTVNKTYASRRPLFINTFHYLYCQLCEFPHLVTLHEGRHLHHQAAMLLCNHVTPHNIPSRYQLGKKKWLLLVQLVQKYRNLSITYPWTHLCKLGLFVCVASHSILYLSGSHTIIEWEYWNETS